jgi:vitamin D 1,25-hydroxylase
VTIAGGRSAWVVTNFDVARRLLTDPRMSSDRTRPEYPRGNAARTEGRRDERPTLLAMDPPEHDRQRRMLTGKFSAKKMGLLREDIERIVHGYLDSMLEAGSPADLVADFALPVPSSVICLLLGVPDLDHGFFQEKSRQLLQGTDATTVRAALQGLGDYFDSLVTKLQREPATGVMGELVADQLAAGDLTRQDVVAMGGMLLVAGHETTASMASLGMISLLDHPDQLDTLRADRSLIPGAVEELLRFLSIAGIVTTRVAASDIDVDGQLIRSGEVVIIDNFIANRDGVAFQKPDVLDVRRADRRHIAFGYGIHQCLGQHLARLELEIIFNALLDRVPTLRLAEPTEQLRLRPGNTIFGVERVPVAW